MIAVPVDAMVPAIAAAAAALPRGAALIDTGSTRRGITPALERARDSGVRAVGGHPLAGSEGRGFDAARADRFEGATFVVLPLSRRGAPVNASGAPLGSATGAAPSVQGVTSAATEKSELRSDIPAEVVAFVADLGATLEIVDPYTHDRALARTSHLPYLLACALRDVGTGAAEAGLAGPSFRDGTRVARSDPAMALGYCRANAAEVADAWRELRARVDVDVQRLWPDAPTGPGASSADVR